MLGPSGGGCSVQCVHCGDSNDTQSGLKLHAQYDEVKKLYDDI